MLFYFGFLLALAVPLASLCGIILQGSYLWLSAGVGLLILPFLDTLIGFQKTEYQPTSGSLFLGRAVLFCYAPLHIALILFSCSVAQTSDWGLGYWLLAGLSIGISTGGIGITISHELVHKKEQSYRILGGVLLSFVCYGHFMVEHVHGHHTWVATPKDPASARKNESFYAFFIRSLVGSFISALEIEKNWISKKKLAWFQNRILLTWLLTFIIVSLLGYLCGAKAVIFFFLQSFVAILFLEIINYLEHYGLSRKQSANGTYEPVSVRHSWDSSRIVSNWFLINLEKHADHHKYPTRDYVALKNYPESPQLPFGYPELVVLSLIPPLWFRIMNPRLEAFERSQVN